MSIRLQPGDMEHFERLMNKLKKRTEKYENRLIEMDNALRELLNSYSKETESFLNKNHYSIVENTSDKMPTDYVDNAKQGLKDFKTDISGFNILVNEGLYGTNGLLNSDFDANELTPKLVRDILVRIAQGANKKIVGKLDDKAIEDSLVDKLSTDPKKYKATIKVAKWLEDNIHLDGVRYLCEAKEKTLDVEQFGADVAQLYGFYKKDLTKHIAAYNIAEAGLDEMSKQLDEVLAAKGVGLVNKEYETIITAFVLYLLGAGRDKLLESKAVKTLPGAD